MKRLYLIGGPMGVGKTTVCQELKRLTAPSVFLDGDWCWDMEPFQVTAETKAMVQENIAFLLGQFLRCSAYETVIFCWVMHQREIIQELLASLPLEGVEVRAVFLAGHGGDAASAHRQGCGRGPAHLGRAGAQPPAAAPVPGLAHGKALGG